MTCVQTTEGIDLVVIGGTAAQKRDIDRGRPQNFYAIGKLATAGGNLHARLARRALLRNCEWVRLESATRTRRDLPITPLASFTFYSPSLTSREVLQIH
jgi:hypothetical protein